MNDLISRQAAIKALHDEIVRRRISEDANDDGTLDEFDTEAILRQLPPTQPEIIRCKDCKHWIPYDWMFSEVWQSKNIADYPEDEIGCDCCDVAMKANDFCSRAERRTDE